MDEVVDKILDTWNRLPWLVALFNMHIFVQCSPVYVIDIKEYNLIFPISLHKQHNPFVSCPTFESLYCY